MSGKEKLMIYPFDIESVPLLRHTSLLDNFEISNLVSPIGWAINGKDASNEDGGSIIGINVSDDFIDSLSSCDTVLFINPQRKCDYNEIIYPSLKIAAESGKNILCAIELDANKEKETQDLCNKNGVYYKNFNQEYEFDSNGMDIEQLAIYDLNTPVIFVLGHSEMTQKFEIQLSLREYLIQNGYKVSQIGSRNYCEMLGFHSFPNFMFSKRYNESEKVILFNHFVKNIEFNEKPDVILVGIPGGVLPFNNVFTNRFGILAFQVSNAISPDATVFSTLYSEYTPEYFELISKSMRYKLGFDVDCFNISNFQADLEMSKFFKDVIYYKLSSDSVNRSMLSLENMDTPAYNILNKDDMEQMSNYLINKLTDYAEEGCV